MKESIYDRTLSGGDFTRNNKLEGSDKAGKKDLETKKEFFSKKSDIGENALKVLEKRYLKKDKEGNSAETAEGYLSALA